MGKVPKGEKYLIIKWTWINATAVWPYLAQSASEPGEMFAGLKLLPNRKDHQTPILHCNRAELEIPTLAQ